MSHNYSDIGSDVAPVVLDDATLIAIGRMFRASAEIENIVTVYLSAIAKLSDAHAVILLGRSPLSKKIELARSFAKAAGEEELARFKQAFDTDEFRAVIEFRNTIAHGTLIGLTDEGRIAFRTAKQIGLDSTSVTMEVNSYLPEEFQHCASAMEGFSHGLEQELRVTTARGARRTKYLHAHPKAAPRRANSSQAAPEGSQ